MSFNIIGDIAGQYKTLMALLAKMPEGEPISVGDMIDRGPQSKEVVEFFMKNGRAVMGNHEHMFLAYIHNKEGFGFQEYPHGCYLRNGGLVTLKQFSDTNNLDNVDIPVEFVEWIENLPTEIILVEDNDSGWWKGCIITHAPIHRVANMANHYPLDYGILWNRDWSGLKAIPDYYQITGHNSHWKLMRFTDDLNEEFGICLDTSDRKLVGMHWPSMKLYEQEFIEEDEYDSL